ncbi:MAG: type I-G CRISPR-associated protein Csb2 [Trebonia sp.]
MATTLAISFPLGRYHANPWDRAVNEGASEWPPSPWRVLRALVATWHTRWPDLPADVMDGILDALADPPSYRTPRAIASHTRHYLPDLDHRKAETGCTDLTLDPFLAVPRDSELLLWWDAVLDAGQREALAKLAELLPYLGRSESVCYARLAEEDFMPDETWWRPDAEGGSRRTRLLAVTRPFDRSVLEATTIGVRKRKRTVPPGTRWVSYGAGDETPRCEYRSVSESANVTAIRFEVVGRAPLMATHGVLLADEAHRQVGLLLEEAGVPDERRRQIMGTRGAASDHRHAHWIPISGQGESGRSVQSLVIWVPDGLRTSEVRAILGLRSMSGQRGGEDGYELRGFPRAKVLFQAAGKVEDVAPELCGRGPARRWRSATPYLMVRHQKPRESPAEHFTADVTAELKYRGRSDAVLTGVELNPRMDTRTVNQYRRYRTKEKLRESRRGTGLTLELESPIAGPLLLGQLSHFGFGTFYPES